MRPQLQDVAQTRIARAGVVHGEPGPSPDQIQRCDQLAVVADLDVLGDFQNDVAVGSLQDRNQRDDRRGQRRRYVQAHPRSLGQPRGGLELFGDAGGLEPDAHPRALRLHEPLVGARAVVEPGQRLEPDDFAGPQMDDRLEDRLEGPGGDYRIQLRADVGAAPVFDQHRTEKGRRDDAELGERRQPEGQPPHVFLARRAHRYHADDPIVPAQRRECLAEQLPGCRLGRRVRRIDPCAGTGAGAEMEGPLRVQGFVDDVFGPMFAGHRQRHHAAERAEGVDSGRLYAVEPKSLGADARGRLLERLGLLQAGQREHRLRPLLDLAGEVERGLPFAEQEQALAADREGDHGGGADGRGVHASDVAVRDHSDARAQQYRRHRDPVGEEACGALVAPGSDYLLIPGHPAIRDNENAGREEDAHQGIARLAA